MSENIAEKKEFNGSPEEIERQIETARSDMGQTVDQLVDRLRPANQVKEAKAKAQNFAQQAKDTFTDAVEGDVDSQKKLGIAAGVVAGVLLLAKLRRRHR
ncbi:DUF3618 domain-containing protein [uncultured Mobiluncus sp.]|uniref:DUF3618 domain-containing protein n=1 Tax=uncultured Mobiluncus sp. TaxID=293425 RepID=UPI002635681B|nr:DUF3618 domain-containing protein [uncultured Mobiluncus sp.]